MTQPEEPVRWLEQADDLPPALSAALAAYEARAPTAAQRDATFAALEARVATPASAPHGLRWRWYGAALGGLVAALAVVVLRQAPAPRTERAPRAAPRAESARAAPAAPAAVELAAERIVASEAPDVPKRAAPARDPAAELALLTPARRVLASDPARSLELIAEHARRFPRGAFAEERDLLRIEALLRGGQRAAAERQARRFRLAYPRSAHLEHLVESFAR